jgi:drug/metabolite transporter (DMT)-like permease
MIGEGRRVRRAQAEVIAGAFLFALSVPAGKVLLRGLDPMAVSAALYLSAGAALGSIRMADRRREKEQGIRGSEWLWLAAVVLAGGILGPLAFFAGLARIPASTAGMLLNFEALFTVAFGATFLGERLGGRGWAGMAVVLAGAALLSIPGEGARAGAVNAGGALLVIAACALWAFDNNLMRRISIRDARQIAAWKGLAGGAILLACAAILGRLGGLTPARAAGVIAIGAVSYGLSLTLFIRGLRAIGVLQTGTLFALAPGFAALLSFLLLRETIALPSVAALAAMTLGALLLATDRHEHMHAHGALVHSHPHVHDAEHRHRH